MTRSIYFSFHYEDVKSFRVNVVRNSNIIRGTGTGNIFSDGSLWEEAKRKGARDLKKLIEQTGLYNTSVTAVLIGPETFDRRWVKFELVKSFERGNGILGIHLNRIRGKDGYIVAKGKNPLDCLGLVASAEGHIYFYELENRKWYEYADLKFINNRKSNTAYFKEQTLWERLTNTGLEKFDTLYRFSDLFKTYCWINDEGNNNFSKWIEGAYSGVIL